MSGLTFDTGVLIAIERSFASRAERRVTRVIESARARKQTITVPSVVLTEWWRGQRGPVARMLDAFVIESIDAALARIAGDALGRVHPGPSAIDAIVMASAARRGDVVYTADVADLTALRVVFPDVRVLGV